MSEPIKATGLCIKTGMRSIFSDVPKVLKKYMYYKDKYGVKNQKMPWEYVSLSKNFKENQTWDYYTGHVVTAVENIQEEFVSFESPAGKYAVFPIRSKNKLLLGLTIGKTKKYIYNVWLPKSKYIFADCEFEYNNEKMFKESPNYIDLYVAIKQK